MKKSTQILLFFILAWFAGVGNMVYAVKLPTGLIKLDGQPAPALRLSNSDGVVRDLKDLRGQWVLVHFWASWCGPCRKEMPSIQALRKQLPVDKMAFFLVNTAESEDTVFEFLTIVAPDLDSTLDMEGAATERWQPRGLPSSFFVDPQGRLQYLALGGRPWMRADYLGFIKQISGVK